MQKEITLKYVQELEYEYFFPPIPKLPRETAEILKLCRETVINAIPFNSKMIFAIQKVRILSLWQMHTKCYQFIKLAKK